MSGNKKNIGIIVANIAIAVASVCLLLIFSYLSVEYLDALGSGEQFAGVAAGFALLFMILGLIAIGIATLIGVILFFIARFSAKNMRPLTLYAFLAYHSLAFFGAILTFIIIV